MDKCIFPIRCNAKFWFKLNVNSPGKNTNKASLIRFAYNGFHRPMRNLAPESKVTINGYSGKCGFI